MAWSTTGVAAAVTMLMVLAPASAGAVPAKVLTAPYKHTVSSLSIYNGATNCGKGTAVKPAWHPLTGVLTMGGTGSAKTCGTGLGYVGGSSQGYGEDQVQIGVPFTVGTNGAHSIGASFSVASAAAATFTSGGCPAKNVNYNPPYGASSYGYCESFMLVEFEAYGQMQDLNNGSWYNYNFSYGFVDNETGWENYTYCYNYGTPACTNTTGPVGYNFAYGYNDPGFSSFTLNGASTFTLWTNGTNMVTGHHYLLVLSAFMYVAAYADATNLLTKWAASTTASLNMATLGNGVTLSSVSVL